MNSTLKILILSLLLIGLVGCQSSEVPPSPDSPGGVTGEYSVATEELGSWANPAVGFDLNSDEIQVIPVRSAYVQGKILKSEAWAWKTIYIYNYNSETWYEEEINAEAYKNTNWIEVQNPIRKGNRIDTLTFFPNLNSLESKYEGENVIAIYTCAKEEGSFDCHGGWQVEGFDVNYYFIDDVNAEVEVIGNKDSSLISVTLPDKLPETLEVRTKALVNNFENVEATWVEIDGDIYKMTANWNDEERILHLPVSWESEGTYDIEVSIYGLQSNKPGNTFRVTGNISYSLPNAPGIIGGDPLGGGFNGYSLVPNNGNIFEENNIQVYWTLISESEAEDIIERGGFASNGIKNLEIKEFTDGTNSVIGAKWEYKDEGTNIEAYLVNVSRESDYYLIGKTASGDCSSYSVCERYKSYLFGHPDYDLNLSIWIEEFNSNTEAKNHYEYIKSNSIRSNPDEEVLVKIGDANYIITTSYEDNLVRVIWYNDDKYFDGKVFKDDFSLLREFIKILPSSDKDTGHFLATRCSDENLDIGETGDCTGICSLVGFDCRTFP